MITSTAGANENALPKIDHFYPSDVHFYFKPSDAIHHTQLLRCEQPWGKLWYYAGDVW